MTLLDKRRCRQRGYFFSAFTGGEPVVDSDLTVVLELTCGLDPEVGFAVESPDDVPEEPSFVPNMAI